MTARPCRGVTRTSPRRTSKFNLDRISPASTPPLHCAHPPHPPQIHLTPSGAADSVAVDFVTFSGAATSCKYGPTAALGSTVPAASQEVTLNTWKAVMNQAELTGLAPQTDYFYSCGSDADGWSAAVNFTHAPARQVRGDR